MRLTLPPLLSLDVVVVTTCGAVSDDKLGIMTAPELHCIVQVCRTIASVNLVYSLNRNLHLSMPSTSVNSSWTLALRL